VRSQTETTPQDMGSDKELRASGVALTTYLTSLSE